MVLLGILVGIVMAAGAVYGGYRIYVYALDLGAKQGSDAAAIALQAQTINSIKTQLQNMGITVNITVATDKTIHVQDDFVISNGLYAAKIKVAVMQFLNSVKDTLRNKGIVADLKLEIDGTIAVQSIAVDPTKILITPNLINSNN